MRKGARQLAFTLPPRPRYGRADFLVGRSNEVALARLESWPDWPARLLHLAGPPGSGKTHLLAIWAARSDATLIDASSVRSDAVAGLVDAGPVALDNVDGSGVDHAALFHLVNRARDGGRDLLFASNGQLDADDIALPDLRSRLRLAPRLLLDAPDDDLLIAVMAKLFADRQLTVSPDLLVFLVRRIERSFEAARSVVTLLDEEALRRGRPVTRTLAAELLVDKPEPTIDDDDADDENSPAS